MNTLPIPRRAIVRGVPLSFADLYAKPTDGDFVRTAREQHHAYRDALAGAGVELVQLPADEAHPDCHFVEDPAVVVREGALLCHLGREDRRGEEPAVGDALRDLGYEVTALAPPATLEGGDVLQVGDTVYVGLSNRTNRAGLDALEALARRHGRKVVGVPVTSALHLKTCCTAFAEDALLLSPRLLDAAPFAGLDIVEVPEGEDYAANCLALGQRVLLPAGYLKTAALLDTRGLIPSMLPMSTFRQADGALTCLSILLR